MAKTGNMTRPTQGAKAGPAKGPKVAKQPDQSQSRSRSVEKTDKIIRNGKQTKRKSDKSDNLLEKPPEKLAKRKDSKGGYDSCDNTEGKGKRSKAIQPSKQIQKVPSTEMDTVEFVDGQNLIEMKVPRSANSEYASDMENDQRDLEVDSDSDAEMEEGEVTYNLQNNNASADGMDRSYSQNDEDDPINTSRNYEEDKANTSTQLSQSDSYQRDQRIMEEKLGKLTNTLSAMQNMMVKKGFFDDSSEDENSDKVNKKKKKEKRKKGNLFCDSSSVTTIYRNAVERAPMADQLNDVEMEITFKEIYLNEMAKRISSSLEEEVVNTSDETIDDNNIQIAQILGPRNRESEDNQGDLSRAEQMVLEAKAVKAKMFPLPGKTNLNINDKDVTCPGLDLSNEFVHSALVDEAYLTVGGHVDDNLKQKIWDNEYVDFAHLLPRDKVSKEEDHRMEFVFRGGMSYLVPVADRESSSAITNYSKWEQAFRVFL